MAQLNFPDNPINGQLYPNPCPVGVTQYQWDSGTGIWRIVGAATGVTPGQYGNEVTVGQFTVDVGGKITQAANIPIQGASVTQPGIVQLTNLTNSFSETTGLSAKGGKYLQDQIGNLADCTVPQHENVVQALNFLQQENDNLSQGAMIWCGYYNANDGIISFISAAGQRLGYQVGSRLPAASAANSGDFFVISQDGNPYLAGDSNAPNSLMFVGDWVISEANRWVAVNASGGQVKASNVSYVPSAPLTATNVQNALFQITQLLRTPIGGATISETKPINPYPGQLWWDDDEGIFYIYYTDVNSSQWVELGGGGSAGVGGGGGDGTVYEIRTGIGLTGGPITTEGEISLVPAYVDKGTPANSTIGGVIPELGFDYDNNTGRFNLKITDDPSGSDPYTAFSQKGANILQQEIQAIAGVNVLAGTYNAETGQLVYVTPVAQNKGFVVGLNLPAPSQAIDNYYVIVIRGGDQGPSGTQVSQAGDWYICQAEQGSTPVWFLIDYENITALASNISVTPPIPGIPFANDVQRALEAIEVQVQDRVEFVLPTSDGVNIQVSNPVLDSNDGTTLSIGVDYASLNQKGIVQLTSDVTGSSETLAITQAAANNLNQKIQALTGANVLAGTYSAASGLVLTITPAGGAAGFRVNQQAPAANLVPDNYYLIVTVSGGFGPPGAVIPVTGVQSGDWFVAENTSGTSPTWVTIDFEARDAAAINVSLSPIPGLVATNVQTGIAELTSRTNECITSILSANNGIVVNTNVANADFGLTSTLALQPATPADIGGVFIPPNVGLAVSPAGGLSVVPATTNSIGGIKVGANLTITPDGTLSATGGGGSSRAQDITVDPPIPGIPTATNVYSALQQIETQVQAVTGTNVLAGTYDGKNGVMVYVTPAGFAKGFRVGVNVPSASTAIDNYYVIVTIGGGAGPTGAQVSQAGDWYICQADGGTNPVWFLIDFENITALASNISVTPPISGITAARDVQNALTLIERQAQDRIETVVGTTQGLQIAVSNPDINSYDGLTLSLGLDYASINNRGIVQLTNDLTGNSSTLAVTQAAANALDQKVQALTGGSVLAGTYNASTGKLVVVTPIGAKNGFVVGQNCPAPKTAIDNFYVIIITGGNQAPPGTSGPTVSQSGDWYFCEAATGQTPIWLLIDFDNRTVDASSVNLAPVSGLSATNVQTGISQLETQVQDRIGVINNTGAGGLTITTGAASVNGKTTSIKLNPATTTDIGGVFVGSAGSGLVLNTSTGSLSLGIASATQLGGFKVGSGLSINATTGVLDVTAGGTGTVTRVQGTGTVSGLTLTGDVTTAGSLVLGGAITVPVSGAWFNGGFVQVRNPDGVANVGRYIDFHTATTSTGYDLRLDNSSSGTLTITGASGAAANVTAATFTASTGFSGPGSGITALNANNISTGTLAIARGGTAGTTAQEARTNILPSQSGQSGKYLTTNGTDVSWGAGPGSGVTSITAGTGLSGGTITSTGTIALLPPTGGAIGGVKAGTNITIAADGTISASGGGGTITSVTGTGTVSGLTLTGGGSTGALTLTLGGSITTPTSANWFNDGFLKVRNPDGVVQTGRYLDFHTASNSSTYDFRLDNSSAGLLKFTAPGVRAGIQVDGNVAAGTAVFDGSGRSGEKTVQVLAGGVSVIPGGSVSDPGFKMISQAGTFYAGMYLNVNNSQMGLSVNGDPTFLLGASQIIAKPDLLCQGSLIASNRMYATGSTGGTPGGPFIYIQKTGTTAGFTGFFVKELSGELKFGISAGTTYGSLTEVGYFGATTANIVGTLQGTTNFVNISASGSIAGASGSFAGQMQANSFRNVAGSFTAGGAGAVTCAGLTSSGAISGSSTITAAGRVICNSNNDGTATNPALTLGGSGSQTGISVLSNGGISSNCPTICLGGAGAVAAFGVAVVTGTITAEGPTVKFPSMAQGTGAGVAVFINGTNNCLYKQASSERYKKNIKTLEDEYGLEAVMNLRPVRYDAKTDEDSDGPGRFVGFIAEECVDYPELVAYDEEDRPETILAENFRPMHHLAIQQLKRENDNLRDIIADLVARVEALES